MDIKSRTRYYMGRSWWKRWKEKENLVPDQQGCFELKRGDGGTLSVPRWDEPAMPVAQCSGRPRLVKEVTDNGACRIGTAKTKGKMRVVTMQSARVKRLLRPVHDAAYSHLSLQPWLVRGTVTSEHFSSLVQDMLPGESLISGDYEASTDNLHADAVYAVIDVLAESLPDDLAQVLRESFSSVYVEDSSGGRSRVVRGSMMGNLLSFVVLCLLNKIMLDRARQIVEGCGPTYRRALINGDDACFPGGPGLYKEWLVQVSLVGFVINVDKSMVSRDYGELNSTFYSVNRGSLEPRYSFGFLASDSWKLPEGTLIPALFEVVDLLKFSTAAWFLNLLPVRRLISRVHPEANSFSRRWWGFLVKKRWFRTIWQGSSHEGLTVSSGVERKLPMVLGPPVTEEADEADIKAAEKIITRDYVDGWRGKTCEPIKKKVLHAPQKVKSFFNVRLERGERVWKRLWLQPVLEMVELRFPHWLCHTPADWIIDQPGLTVVRPVRVSLRSRLFRPFLPDDIVPVIGSSFKYYQLQ